MNQLLTVPNLMTLTRILLAPVMVWILLERWFLVGFFVVLGIGLSDAFDGWIARKLDQQTDLGAALDPVADKVMSAAVVIPLLCVGVLPVWFVAIVLGRDVLLVLGAGVLALMGKKPQPATRLGKWNTILLGWTVLWSMLAQVAPVLEVVMLPAMIVVSVMTFVSGLHYAWICLAPEGKEGQ